MFATRVVGEWEQLLDRVHVDTGVLEVSGTADFEGHSDRVQIVTDEPAAGFSFIVTGASGAGETFDLGGVCYLP